MYKRIAATILGISLSVFVIAQNTVQDYVNRFSSVAIDEMKRTGVPASIILAQGILTSSFGNSQLALQANNHFNLKCEESWDGELFYKWERKAKNKRPSCFRVYEKPEESFLEYTSLVSKNAELSALVMYNNVGYKNWIKKLIQTGLTNKTEDQLLRVIETFTLVEFDELPKQKRTRYISNREIYNVNGIKAVVAKKDDTPLSIASDLNIPYKKLLKYNDLEEGSAFYENQYVFVEAKRSRSKVNIEYHYMRPDETLYDVAQLYGIRLKSLCKLNHVNYNDKVAVGERLYLIYMAPVAPRLQGQRPPSKPANAILPPSKPKKDDLPIADNSKPKQNNSDLVLPPSKPDFSKEEVTSAAKPIIEDEKPNSEPNKTSPNKPTVVTEWQNNTTTEKPNRPSPGKPSFSNSEVKPSQSTQTSASKPDFGYVDQPEDKISSNAPGRMKPSGTFDNDDVIVINQIPTSPPKPAFNEDLVEKPKQREETGTVEPSAPRPEFDMDEEETLPVVKKKREGYHIVARGETLYAISKKYGITVAQIKEWNDLGDNIIRRGQELKVKK